MTEDEVLSFPAGQDLDKLVSLAMGWTAPRVGGKATPFPFRQDEVWSSRNPPKVIEDWRSDYHWREPGGSCWEEPHDFSKGKNFDLLCKWMVGLQPTLQEMREKPGGSTPFPAFEFSLEENLWVAGWKFYAWGYDDFAWKATGETLPLAVCRVIALAGFKREKRSNIVD